MGAPPDGPAIGIDVGGTFTDLVSVSAAGEVESRKVLTSSGDQSAGVMAALAALGVAPHAIARLVHGTTTATNMLLERTGARVVLCATEGATDLLELRRQSRASLYDLARHHPDPLVPADRCVPVAERVAPEGVVRALTEAGADAAVRAALERRPETIAVALLHAPLDPRHERALREAFRRAAPALDVTLSSDVLPEIREYERTATTVAEAYLRPGVSRYLEQLAERLAGAGAPAPWVMTSAGAVLDAGDAARGAAALALSGPAGGVLGAAHVARLAGVRDALTIDIGGTSADAGLILDGEPLTEPGGDVAGVPIALPRVLVETVSAGGGSIGWVDDGGALRVGPRSAGATPGPAAFGAGGTEATVTDAHVVLGSLRAGLVSGGVELRAAPARQAVARLAERLGDAPERVAAAMVRTANAAMSRALRRVSVERGVDPRRCTLIAFGGGGPLHACALAEQLDVRAVLVPPHAGVLSALGLAIAEERRDALASVMRVATAFDAADARALCDALARRAGPQAAHRWWIRARYEGQGHELDVAITPEDHGGLIAERFAALHEARYGFRLERAVELISARGSAAHPGRAARLGAGDGAGARLAASTPLRGPALVHLGDASMLVAGGWVARGLPMGGWLLERDP